MESRTGVMWAIFGLRRRSYARLRRSMAMVRAVAVGRIDWTRLLARAVVIPLA